MLWLAAAAGVPARIAHSHTDARDEPAQALRRLYLRASRALLRRSATRGLAASEAAAAALFGEGWREDPRVSVLHCGLDLAPCRREYDRAAVRAELGLPDGALVVGHVGRFVPEKNHAFLLQVVVELLRIEPRTQALLVGDGPLRDATARRARELGLADRVIFAGLRRDVPRLMRAAMDVFVFPSRFEGLGLAVVEAQAAGLPSVVSDGVPREVEETGSVRFLPLSAPASAWARAARDAAAARAPVPRSSRFDVTESIDRLSAVYREHAHRV